MMLPLRDRLNAKLTEAKRLHEMLSTWCDAAPSIVTRIGVLCAVKRVKRYEAALRRLDKLEGQQ